MHASNLDNILKEFQNNGYVVIEDIIDHKTITDLYSFIQKQIIEYSEELAVSFAKYVYCTGRWGPTSRFFTNDIFSAIDIKLKQMLEDIIHNSLMLQKQNVICKNQYITGSLALHQDISYSYNSPYNFTLWLSLDDILPNSGEIIVIPKSHKWRVAKAVDFWSPFFKDKKIEKYSNNIKKIYLKAGSGLLFDSRLWHGSVENLTKASRYVYVSRWLIEDYQFTEIPKPQPLKFGMWNCHKQLTEMLLDFNGAPSNEISFENLIENTIDQLIKSYHSPTAEEESKKLKKVIAPLENLMILHKASMLHDAGDLCGKIYKNIWYDLLPIIYKSLRVG